MCTAFNLASDREMTFEKGTDPLYAVCYAYLDDLGLSSQFVSDLKAGQPLSAIAANLPICEGKLSISCGDWASKKRPFMRDRP